MKKLLMSLLLVGGGFFGLVRGAQQMAPEELAIWKRQQDQDKVPSLQMLCLRRLLANKTEEQAQEVLKQLPETFYVKSFHGDISREILKFALEEYKKDFFQRTSPLKLYKEANPGFGLLLAKGAVSYSLSIQDLIDEGVAMNESSLNFRKLDITSLDGLQNIDLPALTHLHLVDNQIREIASGVFNKLLALRVLELHDNQIREIAPGAFNKLPALEWLHLYRNQITEIAPGAFDNLLVLRTLDLAGNQIREIAPGAFNNLPALRVLNLSQNKIERIMSGAFNNLPVLEYLFLSGNQIREIAPEVRAQLPARTRVCFK